MPRNPGEGWHDVTPNRVQQRPTSIRAYATARPQHVVRVVDPRIGTDVRILDHHSRFSGCVGVVREVNTNDTQLLVRCEGVSTWCHEWEAA